MNLTKHPGFDLSLKQLLKEKEKIIEFNKRVSKPGYKFSHSIKPTYPKYLDTLIKIKKEGLQLNLF